MTSGCAIVRVWLHTLVRPPEQRQEGLETQSRAPLIVVLEDEQVYVATHKQWCNMRSCAIMANAGSFSVTFFLGGPLCIRMSPINRTRNLLALFSNLRELHCWV